MSLAKRIALLARKDVPFDRAESLLRPSLAPKPQELTGGEKMAAEKAEWASLHGLQASHEIAREGRLRRWLALDIAPPDDTDE